MKRFEVRGGFKMRMVSAPRVKKSGPAEGVGVWGQSPHVEPMSTIIFNIDMYVDIHLNIDCHLSFDLICRTYSSLASHNFAFSSASDKWVFASRTLSSMAWYAAMAAGLQKRIVCFEVYVHGPCDCWVTHRIFFHYWYACWYWLPIWNLKSGLNNHMHMHVHMGPKKNFSNSWWVYIHVCWHICTCATARVWYGIVSLRISNPGWKKSICHMTSHVSFCSENFWSGLEKLDIACIVTHWFRSWDLIVIMHMHVDCGFGFVNFWSGPGFLHIRCIVQCLNQYLTSQSWFSASNSTISHSSSRASTRASAFSRESYTPRMLCKNPSDVITM